MSMVAFCFFGEKEDAMNTEHYMRSEEYARLAKEVIAGNENLSWIPKNVRIDFKAVIDKYGLNWQE